MLKYAILLSVVCGVFAIDSNAEFQTQTNGASLIDDLLSEDVDANDAADGGQKSSWFHGWRCKAQARLARAQACIHACVHANTAQLHHGTDLCSHSKPHAITDPATDASTNSDAYCRDAFGVPSNLAPTPCSIHAK